MRNSYLAIPLYLASIVPFILLAGQLDINVEIKYVALGAIGWWSALLLRLPLVLILKRFTVSLQKSSKYIVRASGPIEEIVRLILLAVITINVDNAFSIGLGWGAIEIVYGLVQLFGLASLNGKNDEKSIEAKKLMKQMGMDKVLESTTPFWGALERFSANALHLSFSLMLVINPVLLLISIPIHSKVNLFVVESNKSSISKSQITLLVFSILLISSVLLLI